MRVIVVVVTRGFRFVPLLPIGGAVFPFIVIVRSAAAVSDDKNVREREGEGEGGDATSIVEERERERGKRGQVDFWSIRDGNLEWSLPQRRSQVGSRAERGEGSQLIRRDDKAEKVPCKFVALPSFQERVLGPSFVDQGLSEVIVRRNS